MAKRSAATKDALVAAALQTLREEGYSGTSARAVARRGGFTQALIYYHFADLEALLLAVLERASSERLARYREALEGVDSVADLAERLAVLYREDVEVGHVKAVQEIVAGAAWAFERPLTLATRLRPVISVATPPRRAFHFSIAANVGNSAPRSHDSAITLF